MLTRVYPPLNVLIGLRSVSERQTPESHSRNLPLHVDRFGFVVMGCALSSSQKRAIEEHEAAKALEAGAATDEKAPKEIKLLLLGSSPCTLPF